MRRSGIWLLVTAVTISITAIVASAANVKLKGGPRAEPTLTDEGLILCAAGELSGLGNEALQVTLNATANPTGQCCNPGESCKVPGHNPAPVQVTGSITINPDDIDKNGNAPFLVCTEPPVSPIPGAPDCPNSSWTENITDMAFTSGDILVDQPVDTLVLTVDCDIAPQTAGGQVPGADVTCVQTQS
jgi:hypothetical protein